MPLMAFWRHAFDVVVVAAVVAVGVDVFDGGEQHDVGHCVAANDADLRRHRRHVTTID